MSRSPDGGAPGAELVDPRIYVSQAHLRGLQGAARGLSFLPLQAAASVLNGRHASGGFGQLGDGLIVWAVGG